MLLLLAAMLLAANAETNTSWKMNLFESKSRIEAVGRAFLSLKPDTDPFEPRHGPWLDLLGPMFLSFLQTRLVRTHLYNTYAKDRRAVNPYLRTYLTTIDSDIVPIFLPLTEPDTHDFGPPQMLPIARQCFEPEGYIGLDMPEVVPTDELTIQYRATAPHWQNYPELSEAVCGEMRLAYAIQKKFLLSMKPTDTPSQRITNRHQLLGRIFCLIERISRHWRAPDWIRARMTHLPAEPDSLKLADYNHFFSTLKVLLTFENVVQLCRTNPSFCNIKDPAVAENLKHVDLLGIIDAAIKGKTELCDIQSVLLSPYAAAGFPDVAVTQLVEYPARLRPDRTTYSLIRATFDPLIQQTGFSKTIASNAEVCQEWRNNLNELINVLKRREPVTEFEHIAILALLHSPCTRASHKQMVSIICLASSGEDECDPERIRLAFENQKLNEKKLAEVLSELIADNTAASENAIPNALLQYRWLAPIESHPGQSVVALQQDELAQTVGLIGDSIKCHPEVAAFRDAAYFHKPGTLSWLDRLLLARRLCTSPKRPDIAAMVRPAKHALYLNFIKDCKRSALSLTTAGDSPVEAAARMHDRPLTKAALHEYLGFLALGPEATSSSYLNPEISWAKSRSIEHTRFLYKVAIGLDHYLRETIRRWSQLNQQTVPVPTKRDYRGSVSFAGWAMTTLGYNSVLLQADEGQDEKGNQLGMDPIFWLDYGEKKNHYIRQFTYNLHIDSKTLDEKACERVIRHFVHPNGWYNPRRFSNVEFMSHYAVLAPIARALERCRNTKNIAVADELFSRWLRANSMEIMYPDLVTIPFKLEPSSSTIYQPVGAISYREGVFLGRCENLKEKPEDFRNFEEMAFNNELPGQSDWEHAVHDQNWCIEAKLLTEYNRRTSREIRDAVYRCGILSSKLHAMESYKPSFWKFMRSAVIHRRDFALEPSDVEQICAPRLSAARIEAYIHQDTKQPATLPRTIDDMEQYFEYMTAAAGDSPTVRSLLCHHSANEISRALQGLASWQRPAHYAGIILKLRNRCSFARGADLFNDLPDEPLAALDAIFDRAVLYNWDENIGSQILTEINSPESYLYRDAQTLASSAFPEDADVEEDIAPCLSEEVLRSWLSRVQQAELDKRDSRIAQTLQVLEESLRPEPTLEQVLHTWTSFAKASSLIYADSTEVKIQKINESIAKCIRKHVIRRSTRTAAT